MSTLHDWEGILQQAADGVADWAGLEGPTASEAPTPAARPLPLSRSASTPAQRKGQSRRGASKRTLLSGGAAAPAQNSSRVAMLGEKLKQQKELLDGVSEAWKEVAESERVAREQAEAATAELRQELAREQAAVGKLQRQVRELEVGSDAWREAAQATDLAEITAQAERRADAKVALLGAKAERLERDLTTAQATLAVMRVAQTAVGR